MDKQGQQSTSLLFGKRSSSNNTSGKRKKRKPAKTINLFTSDEKQSNEKEKGSYSTLPSSTTSLPSSNQEVNEAVQNSSMNDQANVQNSTLPSVISSSLCITPSSSLSAVTTTSSVTAEPVENVTLPFEVYTNEFKFHCNKAMFGELYGHALSPAYASNNRIYLILECVIHRNDQPDTEKIFLSVGQNDVQQLLVYFGRSPSFLAIETTQRFAEVACKHIGREVLVPGSNDPKKRYIILALKSAFKYEQDALSNLIYLFVHITPWAKVTMLTLLEAKFFVQQANLDVSQQEFSYSELPKCKRPIETIVTSPSSLETGGIQFISEVKTCFGNEVDLNLVLSDKDKKHFNKDENELLSTLPSFTTSLFDRVIDEALRNSKIGNQTSFSSSTSAVKHTECKFQCNKAMFGELYGHALSPFRVANNRIFLSLECVIQKDDRPITEKFTLSVGENDVKELLVYFGHSPSFLAIETAQRFADVACTRIGRAVLVPGSNDPKKRYIIFALKSAFKCEQEAVTEVNHLLAHVTPWAKVKILSLSEAMLVVQQANLNVHQ